MVPQTQGVKLVANSTAIHSQVPDGTIDRAVQQWSSRNLAILRHFQRAKRTENYLSSDPRYRCLSALTTVVCRLDIGNGEQMRLCFGPLTKSGGEFVQVIERCRFVRVT